MSSVNVGNQPEGTPLANITASILIDVKAGILVKLLPKRPTFWEKSKQTAPLAASVMLVLSLHDDNDDLNPLQVYLDDAVSGIGI